MFHTPQPCERAQLQLHALSASTSPLPHMQKGTAKRGTHSGHPGPGSCSPADNQDSALREDHSWGLCGRREAAHLRVTNPWGSFLEQGTEYNPMAPTVQWHPEATQKLPGASLSFREVRAQRTDLRSSGPTGRQLSPSGALARHQADQDWRLPPPPSPRFPRAQVQLHAFSAAATWLSWNPTLQTGGHGYTLSTTTMLEDPLPSYVENKGPTVTGDTTSL